jgi:hypothetical protein
VALGGQGGDCIDEAFEEGEVGRVTVHLLRSQNHSLRLLLLLLLLLLL